jgi:nucleotide-binding universal stress UspA family protein
MKALVGYDGSEAAQRALQLAATLAGESGDIGVVHVLSPRVAEHDQEAQQEELLAEAQKTVGVHGKTAASLRRRGDPARELIDAAREIDADLLVVGSRGRGLVSSAVLGSVSSALAAGADSPVLIVPASGGLTGRCVIAAVDGSPGSGEATRAAHTLSGRLDVPLLLAHAYNVPLIPGTSVVPYAPEELAQAARDEAEQLLADAAEEVGMPNAGTRLVTGPSPVAAILSLAEDEEAWMIAVGSRGRGAVKSAVLGSFSSALAGQSSNPVLVVPPGARQAFAP